MENQLSSCHQLLTFEEIWQESIDWLPNSDQQDRFESLYQATISANQSLNLTRITQPDDFWEKHLWDSLRGIKELIKSDNHLKVIDIGTGAGFPGLPIAIARADWDVTLVDSTAKKIGFIQTVIPTLNITNVHPIVARSEALGQQSQHRCQYDLSVVRAVATANVCAEYTLPLLKIGGTAILYRGNWTESETDALELALDKLGGKINKIDCFYTPLTNSIRHCIWLKKITDTPPQFPRAIGVPTQKPL